MCKGFKTANPTSDLYFAYLLLQTAPSLFIALPGQWGALPWGGVLY